MNIDGPPGGAGGCAGVGDRLTDDSDEYWSIAIPGLTEDQANS